MQTETSIKVLWANVYCLLDTSSGASIAVREILSQLVNKGHQVSILGSTIFDSTNGVKRISENWEAIKSKAGQMVLVNDGNLQHRLLVTNHTDRSRMTSGEEAYWYDVYKKMLDEIKPDLVFFYGGQPFDFLIAELAKENNIPVVSYLANPNYSGKRWCRDVDTILTDSQATADYYLEKEGYKILPIGAFINPWSVIATEHTRKNILFVNPVLEKGAIIVAQLAIELSKKRPDIHFEIIESRGTAWKNIVESVAEAMKIRKVKLKNITVTPMVDDMRPVYGRAKILLAPSLWWESGGRVIAEAMLNGVPAIVTNRGGCPENLGDGGFKIDFPAMMYEPPPIINWCPKSY